MIKKLLFLALGLLVFLSAGAQNDGEKMIDPYSHYKPKKEVRVSSVVVATPARVNQNKANGLMPKANKKGKWGYVDANGKFKIKAAYDEASWFFKSPVGQNLAFCKKNGKYGLMKDDGTVYLGFNYDNLKLVNYSYVVAKIADGYNIVILEQEPVLTEYDEFALVDEAEYAIGKKNGKAYILGKNGTKSAKMNFEEAEDIGGGMTLVKNNGKYGVINHKQDKAIPCKYAYAVKEGDYYKIGDNQTGFGVVSHGDVLVSPDCKQTLMVPSQEAVAYLDESGKYNLVLLDGTVIFEGMDKIGNYSANDQKYNAGFASCKMVYDFPNKKFGMIVGKTTTWLPEGSHSFTFIDGVGKYKAKTWEPQYVSKKGKLLPDLHGAAKVRALNDKYFAVCRMEGIKSSKTSSATAPVGIGGSGDNDSWEVHSRWEVANADGKFITKRSFYYISDFNANGELQYECFDRKTWSDVKGKMKLNGDNVIYLK